MPNSIIKHDVKEGKGSKKSLEKKWKDAGKAADKSEPDNKYALQNYIYHKMTSAVERLIATQEITADTAEQAIRDAVSEAHPALGRPTPISVHFGGRTVPFMAHIAKVPSAPEQARGMRSKIYLMTIKWGKLIKGNPNAWIANYYELNGKDQLVDGRQQPHEVDAHEAEAFFHACHVPVPPHHQ